MEGSPLEERPHGAWDLPTVALVVFFLGLIVVVGALMVAPILL
jgi:hypothetical protein